MRRPSRIAVALGGSLVLAGSAGYLTAAALGKSSAPARTVTVDVATGERGPPGPKGDPGPQGPAGLACPSGYSPGELVINAPKGQVRVWTCLHD